MSVPILPPKPPEIESLDDVREVIGTLWDAVRRDIAETGRLADNNNDRLLKLENPDAEAPGAGQISLRALVQELGDQDPKVRPGLESALSLMDRLDDAIKKDGDRSGVGGLGKIVCLVMLRCCTLESRINRLEAELSQ